MAGLQVRLHPAESLLPPPRILRTKKAKLTSIDEHNYQTLSERFRHLALRMTVVMLTASTENLIHIFRTRPLRDIDDTLAWAHLNVHLIENMVPRLEDSPADDIQWLRRGQWAIVSAMAQVTSSRLSYDMDYRR